jgi:hypothetical protein
VIQYKTVKFHRGAADDIPLFESAPSAEGDQAWRDLYVGTSFKARLFVVLLVESPISLYRENPQVRGCEDDQRNLVDPTRPRKLHYSVGCFPPAALSGWSLCYLIFGLSSLRD